MRKFNLGPGQRPGSLVVALLVAGCAPAETQGATPDYCRLIAAEGAEGIEFARLLGAFADGEGLQNLDVPEQPVLRDQAGRTEFVVKTYMGPLGAVLTGHTLRGEPDVSLFQRLDVFLQESVQPRWSVRDCAEVPEFDAPLRFGD
jgi:hypothetical protein